MSAVHSAAFDWPGADPAVVLVHGFTSTPWEIVPIAEALRRRGNAVVAPMLPGHGTSPDDLARCTWDDWVAAVDSAFARARASCEHVVLVGASLGGLLALDAGVRHAQRGAIGVVTLAAALRLTGLSSAVLTVAHGLGRALPPITLPKVGGTDVQDTSQRADNPAYDSYPLRAAREFIEGQARVREILPQLALPLLAVHGAHDETTPLSATLEVVRRVGSADVGFVLAPRSGHLLGVDFDHAMISSQIAAFLDHISHPP